MEYNWNVPLMAGTIVCTTYKDFNNEDRIGVFCVLYDEQLDNNVFAKKNTLCVKISTKTTNISNYSVRVDMGRNTFLESPCIACCSKVHVLHKESNIYKVLGVLDQGTVKQITKTYLKFSAEVQRQLLDRI